MTTPGFLVGQATAAIIASVHQAPSGTWALIEASSYGTDETELTFAVGLVYPNQADERERVTITVKKSR